MADPEAPLPPIEIAWKLAATTQPLAAGEPARAEKLVASRLYAHRFKGM